MHFRKKLPKRIALIVVHPARELPGAVLLASEIARRGSTCLLVPTDLMVHEIISLAPDLVILPHLRRKWNARFFKRFFDAGIDIAVLDTEGADENHEWFKDSLVQDAAIRDRVFAYLCWGPRFRDFLEGVGFFRDRQLHVTGCPRMDFYAPPWNEASLRATAGQVGELDQFVLFCCNFVLANPRASIADAMRREIEMFSNAVVFGTFDERRPKHLEALHGMIELANQLSERFPDTQFVLRPHPYEDVEIYQRLLQPRPNLQIRWKGSVDGWLIRAKAVIQRSCSTAVEASFMSTPALTPDWLPKHLEVPMPMSDACSTAFADLEALSKALEAILEGTFELPDQIRLSSDRIIRDLYFKNDGQAHRRVADVVCGEVTARFRARHLEKCRRVFRKHIARQLRRASPRPRWWTRFASTSPTESADLVLPEAREARDSFRRGETYFTADDVSALLREIKRCASGAFDGVQAATADSRGEYHFGYQLGDSISVFS